MPLQKLQFRPGVNRETTSYTNITIDGQYTPVLTFEVGALVSVIALMLYLLIVSE